MGKVATAPKVIISGAITDDGMDWAVFCYLCEQVVSERSKDSTTLLKPQDIHKALHRRANDEV